MRGNGESSGRRGTRTGWIVRFCAAALGVLVVLNVEAGVVTPPVGLNLFAVSGTSKIPLPQVLKGTIPFVLGDIVVLLLVIFFPGLATWLPDRLIQDVFK